MVSWHLHRVRLFPSSSVRRLDSGADECRIIRNEKIPPGDYICVMCRAGAAHLFAIDEDRLLWQDNARQLALTRSVQTTGLFQLH